MTTTPKTEATRLAEFKDLEYWPAGVGLTDWVESVCAELLRLDAALADELNNRDVLDKMLTQCITERDQLRAQVERLQGGEPVTLTEEVFGPIVKAAFDAGWAACRASELVGDNAKEFAWDMSGDEITERLIASLSEKGKA